MASRRHCRAGAADHRKQPICYDGLMLHSLRALCPALLTLALITPATLLTPALATPARHTPAAATCITLTAPPIKSSCGHHAPQRKALQQLVHCQRKYQGQHLRTQHAQQVFCLVMEGHRACPVGQRMRQDRKQAQG